jgi:hypothetical protein
LARARLHKLICDHTPMSDDEAKQEERHVEVIDIRALIGDYSSSDDEASSGVRDAAQTFEPVGAAAAAASGERILGRSTRDMSAKMTAATSVPTVAPLTTSNRKASFIKSASSGAEQAITVAYNASPRRRTGDTTDQ